MDIFDPHILVRLLVVIATSFAALSILMTFFPDDQLESRMRSVIDERERLRQSQRQRLDQRNKAKGFAAFAQNITRSLDLVKWLGEAKMREQLLLAGYRSPGSEMIYAFFHLVIPIGMLIFGSFYVFVLLDITQPASVKVLIVAAAVFFSYKLPSIYITNEITKRQQLLRRGSPDMIDLLLIAVESGSSIEIAFQKVGAEIGGQCVPLAEEIAVMLAELSYLPDRRVAYENFVKRTQIDSIKQLVMVLSQSEKYGTSLSGALRVVAEESRQTRMAEAEKKAAALPPKLTVPMILFFLPVLFAILITPAAIQISNLSH
jgi:tight adherence protein C